MKLSNLSLRLQSLIADLRADTRGVAATEFVIIVPVMLVMFFGTVELSSGVAVNRKVTLIARTLSDLTSQAKSVGDSDMTNFSAASMGILWPYDSTPTKSTITELYIDPATSAARVQWSKGFAPHGQGTAIGVPGGLIGKDASGNTLPNQYLIFSEVSYLYQPIVGYVMAKAGVNLSDTAFTRPRQSTCVSFSNPPDPSIACTTF